MAQRTAIQVRANTSPGKPPGAQSAYRLQLDLADFGINSDVHVGTGIALVSVWVDLVIWVECASEGWRYRWWTGRISSRNRYVWAFCPADAHHTAARRIAIRYRELLAGHPLSETIADLAATAETPGNEVAR
ncbi:hypothetical protein [Nonomuraea sp. NPDC003804]|uniref:hypothetical protein n=1 Tax=Nonomuraea sp. NPDC003804 TaxID=3154547 RepID=UPI0033AB69F9